MLDRHIRRAGIQLIEAALAKKASAIFNPLAPRSPSTSATILKAQAPDTNTPPKIVTALPMP